MIHNRRPHVLGLDGEQLHQRLRLGFEALHCPFSVGQRTARGIELLARRGVRSLRGGRLAIRGDDCALRGLQRSGERGKIGIALRGGGQAGLDVADLGFDPDNALVLIADRAGQLIAHGGQVGKRSGQFAEGGLGCGERLLGRADPLVDTGARLGDALHLLLERLLLGSKPLQRCLGVGHQRALALDVLGQLNEASLQLGEALARAGLLLVERISRADQALQRGARTHLGIAQRRHCDSGFVALLAGLGLRDGGVGHGADAEILGAFGVADFGLRVDPAQMEQCRLGLADIGGDDPVADRLASLALERVHLAGELRDHVLDAQQVLLGGAQPQLGFVAPLMQAGNAGGLFQNAAALLRLRLDDLADAALMDEGRRARAGRGVGEHGHDVARAHVVAVDAVDRALFALDPT